MKTRTLFLALLLQVHLFAAPVTIPPSPCACVYTPDSALARDLSQEAFRMAGQKPRVSTCTGVDWFMGSQFLFTINMHVGSLQVYRFDEQTLMLEPIKIFENGTALGLNRPENLAFSRDRKWLAIPNMRSGKVRIYATDQTTFLNPKPKGTIGGEQAHGATFSPDGKFLIYAGTGENAKICIYKLIPKRNGKLICRLIQTLACPFPSLRPKTVDFTEEGCYLVVGYCNQVYSKIDPDPHGLIASYHFDPEEGQLDPSPISIIEGLESIETIKFYPGDTLLFAVDQINSRITGHSFNPKTGVLGETWVALEGPDSELALPHGLAFSPDGKFLAVTNLLYDKINIYSIKRGEGS